MKTTSWKHLRKELADEPGAQEVIAEHAAAAVMEIGLYELRRRRALSQTVVAEAIGVTQPAVSQLERADDAKISTLRDYIAGLGGELRLAATFDDGSVYELAVGGSERG